MCVCVCMGFGLSVILKKKNKLFDLGAFPNNAEFISLAVSSSKRRLKVAQRPKFFSGMIFSMSFLIKSLILSLTVSSLMPVVVVVSLEWK